MAGRRTARQAASLPRFKRDEVAAGTMASYVVGCAVFVLGSSVLMAFVVEPPGNPGSGLEQQDLKSKASDALSVLMGTAGSPANWSHNGSTIDRVARLGLVEQGSSVRLDPSKYTALARGRFYYGSDANGFVDYTEARNALGLEGYDFHLRVTPLLEPDTEYFGTRGMGDYRIAYIGDWEGAQPAATGPAALEQAALKDLDVGFTNFSRVAVLGTGDVFRDDSTLLKTTLVPLLGTRVAQVAISQGAGTKYDFNRVNATDVATLVNPTLLPDSEKSLALSTLDAHGRWQLGYTKSREIRATIGSFNTTGQSSVTLTWKEVVDTQGASGTRDEGDYGYVEVSPDGGASWVALTNDPSQRSTDRSDLPPNGLWTDRTVTLSALNCAMCLGKDEVLVALHWIADGDANTGHGWVVDEVRATGAGALLANEGFETPEYQLLVIGSNVDQEAFTPSEVKNAIRDYVQSYGGRILVLGGDQNVQWLQPLFHVGLREASPGVSNPDPTHPLLTVPNDLDWQGFEDNGRAWSFGSSSDSSLFNMVVGTEAGQHVLTVSSTGAFGGDGGIILTSWLPHDMPRDQRLPFLANAITYGRFHHLYMELGPEVPQGVPVAAVSRTAVMEKTTDKDDKEYVELSFVLYLWRGNASASLPSATLPSAPQGFSGTPGDKSVTLTWTAPIQKGSSAVKAYTVYRGTSSGAYTFEKDVGNVLTWQDSGLTNGVTYYYRVAARNDQGNGVQASEIPITPSVPPSKPESPSAAGGAGYIVLTWTEPATHGGVAVTGYQVWRSTSRNVDPMDGVKLAETGTTTTYTDLGLGFPVTAYYRIVAVNARGAGAPSNEVEASTVAIPDAPTTPVATPGRDSITIHWTPPYSSLQIKGYNIFAGSSPGNSQYLTSTDKPNFTETGLGMGVTRYYRVRAWSDGGAGGLSPETSATTFRLGSEPTNVAANGGPDMVTVTWSPPSDLGGSEVLWYHVYNKTSTGQLKLLANVSNVTFSYQHAGLDDNATYHYRVSAITGAGEGPTSAEVSARTWDVPKAPVLTAYSGPGFGRVTLQWVAPVDAGNVSATIQSYNVYRGIAKGQQTFHKATDMLSYTDQNLDPLVTYWYYVRAVTQAGEGTPSNEIPAVAAGTDI